MRALLMVFLLGLAACNDGLGNRRARTPPPIATDVALPVVDGTVPNPPNPPNPPTNTPPNPPNPTSFNTPNLPGPISSSKASQYCAPAGESVSMMNTTLDGKSGAVLPNGRHVTPAGNLELEVGAAKPFEVAVSPDENYAVTVNSGSPASITFIGPLNSGTATATNTPLRTVFMGAVFSQDSKRFYLGGGDSGLVWVGDTASRSVVGSVNLNGDTHKLTRPMPRNGANGAFTGAFVTRLALTQDGKTLYALDQAGFAVHRIDTGKIAVGLDANGNIVEPDNFAAVLGKTATGRYPFGIALSPDDQQLFVSNIGVLAFTGLRPNAPTNNANIDYPLCFAVQGYPDDLGAKNIHIKKTSIGTLSAVLRPLSGSTAEILCGYIPADVPSYLVPPVGDPNAPEASSVFVYAVDTAGALTRQQVVKTGALVGELDEGIKTHAGNHPNALVVGSTSVFVSNGSDDSISVIDRRSLKETQRIKLTPLSGFDAVLKGIQPVDLALSADEKTLYVAEAGLNSIGVIEVARQAVVGRIPTNWWTSAVAVSKSGGTLYATSARGRGSPPLMSSNANTIGTFHRIPTPNATALAAHTAQVMKNNGLTCAPSHLANNPIPSTTGTASTALKRVVFIFKENAKYDYLMGHITATTSGQTVNGVPAISLGAATAVNHTGLAQNFTFSDNFYLEPSVSSDGHRWLGGSYTTEFEETNWPASYGGGGVRNNPSDPETIAQYPGRLGYPGADGGPNVQDYNKHGGLFVHLARHGISFVNFGLGLELTASDEGGGLEPTGARHRINVPLETVMRDSTDPLFPTYNTAIPDAPVKDASRFNRYTRFKQVFEANYVKNGVCTLPAVTTIYYPNDHGGGADGIEPNWTIGRFIQDNDAALGLTLELLSKSPCWDGMTVFVTEDDTQSGSDHVDGSRAVNLVAGSHVRRGTVLKTHVSLSSMFKTTYQILGIPPLTLYDALATDLRGMFTNTKNLAPYSFVCPAYQPTGNPPTPQVCTPSAPASPVGFAPQLLKAGAKLPPWEQQLASWRALTAEINFSKPDADEFALNCAIQKSIGLWPAPQVCPEEDIEEDE
jgi:sugar lactone lactonase YvrE